MSVVTSLQKILQSATTRHAWPRKVSQFLFYLRSGDEVYHQNPQSTVSKKGTYQPKRGKEVIIEAHQVNLANCCQGLLLRKLLGTRTQLEPLCTHPHGTTAHDDHPVAIYVKISHHFTKAREVAEVEGVLLRTH
jgi:hypothetical protein